LKFQDALGLLGFGPKGEEEDVDSGNNTAESLIPKSSLQNKTSSQKFGPRFHLRMCDPWL